MAKLNQKNKEEKGKNMANDKMTWIALTDIVVRPEWNARGGDWTKAVDPETGEGWEQFAANIKENGVKVPVEARPAKGGKVELVSGFRRHKAATEAGLKEIPVIVRELSEEEARLANIRENTARQNLRGADLAWALNELVKENPVYRQAGGDTLLATHVGLGQPHVSKLTKIMADTKVGITKQWRDATVPISIREIYAVAGLPKEKQDAAWAEVLGAKSANGASKGPNAWKDAVRKKAHDFGFQLGTLVRLELILDVKGDWRDVLEAAIKMPGEKCKINDKISFAKHLENGYEEGMADPEEEKVEKTA